LESYKQKVVETATFLRERIGAPPVIGMLSGTGLGESAEGIEIGKSFAYCNIPNFPVSTVQSHKGNLIFGTLHGKPVISMQGRFHLYEGYAPETVTFPIRVMTELGVSLLILTNASGGLNTHFHQGDIMVIKDHINLTGSNPLVGPNEEEWGDRFPDMTSAYDGEIRNLAEKSSQDAGFSLQKGVYAGLKGPSLETPAEMRFLRTIGADAVGFSTVMESIVAIHCGMKVLGLSTITNMADPDHPKPASVEEIIQVAEGASKKIQTIINGVVGQFSI